jgi:hypothetical protein
MSGLETELLAALKALVARAELRSAQPPTHPRPYRQPWTRPPYGLHQGPDHEGLKNCDAIARARAAIAMAEDATGRRVTQAMLDRYEAGR